MRLSCFLITSTQRPILLSSSHLALSSPRRRRRLLPPSPLLFVAVDVAYDATSSSATTLPPFSSLLLFLFSFIQSRNSTFWNARLTFSLSLKIRSLCLRGILAVHSYRTRHMVCSWHIVSPCLSLSSYHTVLFGVILRPSAYFPVLLRQIPYGPFANSRSDRFRLA